MKVRIEIPRWGGPPELAGIVEYTRAGGLVLTPAARSAGWLRGLLETYRPKALDLDTNQPILRSDAELVASLPDRMHNQEVVATEIPDTGGEEAEGDAGDE
jgi:hypothetical protein